MMPDVTSCFRGSPVKMLVKSLSQVRQVSAGSNHTVILTADGYVLTCGSNQVCSSSSSSSSSSRSSRSCRHSRSSSSSRHRRRCRHHSDFFPLSHLCHYG